MRVLQVVPTSGPGGAESIVASLSASLKSVGVGVTVASSGTNPYLYKKLQSLNIQAIRFSSFEKRAVTFELIDLIRKTQPHILHSHMFDANLPAAIAAKTCNLPVVLTLHSTVHELEAWKRRKAYSLISKLSSRVVCVSGSVNTALIKAGVSPKRIICVHNGVDIHKFGAERDCSFRTELGIPEESPLVGMVANIRAAKDHELLLRAAVRVISKLPNTCFVFVGDGDLGRLRNLTHELGLEKNVWFTGLRDDVSSVLSSLDLFVLASKIEGLPVSIVEAMAAGLPVVASDVGGVHEVVKHGQTGFLVPPSDVDALAGRVCDVLSDHELAERLGRSGRERAERFFSLEAMSSAYVKLYEECINR